MFFSLNIVRVTIPDFVTQFDLNFFFLSLLADYTCSLLAANVLGVVVFFHIVD